MKRRTSRKTRSRAAMLVLLIGIGGCASRWHEMNSPGYDAVAAMSAHDDSLYHAWSQKPLDSLTVRQYDWVVRERERRAEAANPHVAEVGSVVAVFVVLTVLVSGVYAASH